MTEAELQFQAMDAMRFSGFTPYETTAFKQKASSGVDKGIPDVILPVPGRRCLFIGLEFKKPGKSIAWTSPEQKAAFDAGHFYVIRSLADLFDALLDAYERCISPEFESALRKLESIVKQMGGAK